jgi:hypothetical protein
MMNRSGNGRRITRDGKKDHRRDEFNGNTGEPKRNGRPENGFNGSEKKNCGSHALGVRITPINHERTAILQQIDDLKFRKQQWNPVATSGDDFYVPLDPESDAGKKHMAVLQGMLEKLKAGAPDIGSPHHNTGPVQNR